MKRRILHKLLFLLIPPIFALISSKEVYAYDDLPIAGTASISATEVCQGSSFTIKYDNVSLFVETPASIMGKYSFVPASSGPPVTGLIQGILVLANDGSGNASDACEPIINSSELSGNIALIDRGSCTFTSKVLKAQQAGAIAVIVVNNRTDPPIAMLIDDPAITIPSIMISKADGDLIKANMNSSPVHIKLFNLNKDGANTWQYWEDASSDWIDFADASSIPLSIETINPHTMVNGLPGNRYRVKASNSIGEVFSNELAVSFNSQPPVAGTAIISETVVCRESPYGYFIRYEGGTGAATWQIWDGLAWSDIAFANSTDQPIFPINGVFFVNGIPISRIVPTYPQNGGASIVNGIPGDRFRVKTTTGGDCISYSNEVAVGYVSSPVAGTASISATDVCQESSFTIQYDNVSLFVENPALIMGKYSLVPAGFGPRVTALIQGILVLADDGSGTASDACEPIINSAELSGTIALIDRGTCSFTSKVLKAQQAGAVAVIVVNNVNTPPFTMTGSDPAITIPSLMISKADGDLIKANMNTSPVHIKLGDLSADTKTWQYWEDASSDWIDFADASPNPLSIEATNPYTMVNGLPGNRYRVKVRTSICDVFSNEIAVSFNQPPVAGTAIISATAACLGSKYFTELVGASNVNSIHYWESYYEADGTWKIYAGSNAPNPLPSIALNPTATVNGLPGDRLRVHHTNSCGDQFSNEVSIIYAPYPEVSITAVPENNIYTGGNPNTIYLGYGPQKVTLQPTVTGDIGNGFKYNWTGAGLSCTNCASPVFTPTEPGNYNFTLTASTLLPASETGNNNALQLDGIDNYIEDNSVVLNAASGFTVEGWIKVNNADGLNGLAAKTRENIPAPFDIYISNGAVNFLVGDGDNYFITTTAGIITSNTWYHIACVYFPTVYYPGGIIKSEIVVYVNGLEQARSEVDRNLIADNGTSFRIGSRSDNYFFTNGQVDEIRVWNTPRNTPDINENMNSTIWANSAGLIAYYKLDETSGTSVMESVSNTNRGILRGSSANWVVPTTAPVQPAGVCPTSKSITIYVKDVRVPGKKTQVYMCHNSSKGSNTIILNPQDVPTHLAHGDALGRCGQVFGTTTEIASKGSGLSIDEAAAGMVVYPNPANNIVTVSFSSEKTEKYQLQVMDITGRAVLTKSDNAIKGNNKVQVNLTGIANGTYLIIVKKGHKTLHTRIVKQ